MSQRKRRAPDGKRHYRKSKSATTVKKPLPWLGLTVVGLAVALLVILGR